MSDGDNCYLAFAEYAMANPQNCLPKLNVVHRSDQWAVTHIEHLIPLDAANATKLKHWWREIITAWRTSSPLPCPKDWSQVANDLRQIAIDRGCSFDMKEVNAMQRGYTVVFTDPLN